MSGYHSTILQKTWLCRGLQAAAGSIATHSKCFSGRFAHSGHFTHLGVLGVLGKKHKRAPSPKQDWLLWRCRLPLCLFSLFLSIVSPPCNDVPAFTAELGPKSIADGDAITNCEMRRQADDDVCSCLFMFGVISMRCLRSFDCCSVNLFPSFFVGPIAHN